MMLLAAAWVSGGPATPFPLSRRFRGLEGRTPFRSMRRWPPIAIASAAPRKSRSAFRAAMPLSLISPFWRVLLIDFSYEQKHAEAAIGLYPHRIVGGHCHHLHSRGHVASGLGPS